jgi:hypothetical protein
MINEKIKLKGSLNVVVYDENKNIKDQRYIPNLVVAVGKEYIAQRMEANSTSVMSHMAVGTGNVVPSVSDTTLVGEIDRLPLDSTTRTANVLTYITTFPAGNATGTIAEAGIFNDPTDNTGAMLCRTRFNEVNKGAADVVVITWNVTVE